MVIAFLQAKKFPLDGGLAVFEDRKRISALPRNSPASSDKEIRYQRVEKIWIRCLNIGSMRAYARANVMLALRNRSERNGICNLKNLVLPRNW
jgi:hypothetical protein